MHPTRIGSPGFFSPHIGVSPFGIRRAHHPTVPSNAMIDVPPSEARPTRRERLLAAVDEARRVLPQQGPLGVFVALNPLIAFQSMPFEEGVLAAREVRGGRAYFAEARYREELKRGRITEVDLSYALTERDRIRPNAPIGTFDTQDVERLLMLHGTETDPAAIRFRIAEEGELATPGMRALFETSMKLVQEGKRPSVVPSSRGPRVPIVRDMLLDLDADDPAAEANAFLIRFLSAYLDEGIARWTFPNRSLGILASAIAMLETGGSANSPVWKDALIVLKAQRARGLDPVDMALASLDDAGFDPDAYSWVVPRILMQLEGFAGLVSRLEANPESASGPPTSLVELLALRLALDHAGARASAKSLGLAAPSSIRELMASMELRLVSRIRARAADRLFVRGYRLFDIARRMGFRHYDLEALDNVEDDSSTPISVSLVRILDAFDTQTRERTFHVAYEHHYFREVMAAVSANRNRPATDASATPRFQVAFCIDDREEGIRRHFEGLGGDHITFGVAGFFGVAVNFTSLDDPMTQALCPVVITPQHRVVEAVRDTHEGLGKRRQTRRALWARARLEVLDGSRSLTRGTLLTALLGTFAILPLTLRVVFPRWADQITRTVRRFLLPEPETRLQFARPDDAPGEVHGFTLLERADRVQSTLEILGLTSGFATLVVLVGHGATTVNNPHHSAYDCGACGGRGGGPNARLFAAFANDAEVRKILKARGIEIPDTTWFLGGLHDTTTDAVALFDINDAPSRFQADIGALKESLEEARRRSAHERCRRFEHAPAVPSPSRALRHVEERAVDLSQPRPELGHAGNAAAFFGRRALTRGLFLDRRAFLVSYDPAIDDDGRILARILGAALPVSAGINLAYTFSCIDPEVWGSGTKLSQNLSALMGVTEGSSGDLRTGLPKQMTEVHEPMRLLAVVEASVETVQGIMNKNAEVDELIRNEWVRLVSIDPDTGVFCRFERGRGFVAFKPEKRALPRVSSWQEWYGGHLELIGPAVLGAHASSAELRRALSPSHSSAMAS